MDNEKLNKLYRAEGWGLITDLALGVEPTEVESSAREVARKALELIRIAYFLGFYVSGEGWNGEYPYADKGINPLTDPAWIACRNNRIAKLLSGYYKERRFSYA